MGDFYQNRCVKIMTMIVFIASPLTLIVSGIFLWKVYTGQFDGPKPSEVKKEHTSIQDTVNLISRKIDRLSDGSK